jgi:hypothetical protein
MKQIAFLLIAIGIPAVALAQASPQNPQSTPPARSQSPLSDNPAPSARSPIWDRIERLPRGEKIKISCGKGPWEHCRFAGATDASVFCEPVEDSDRAVAYQINRASIADFKIDHDVRNGRLAFAAFVLSGGIVIGFQTLHATHDESAAVFGGTLGALLGGVPGVAASCIAGECVALNPPPPEPAYGFSYNLPLHRLRHRSLRRAK